MDWTFRKGTKAAQKHPPNWEELCYRSLLRKAWMVAMHEISAALRINADQTQVTYQPNTVLTYEKRGSKQVPIIGKDDKCAVTVMVSIAASGEFLPLQVIFKGRLVASLPSPHPIHQAKLSQAYNDALALGWIFQVAGVLDTYWANQDTMKSWLDQIVAPYFERKKEELGLRSTQLCIVRIDVWSVHASLEFRTYVWEKHPSIVLMFVPGGCTGVFQPCNVGIQRPLKQAITQAQSGSCVQELLSQFEDGRSMDEAVLDESPHGLQNHIPAALMEAWKKINCSSVVLNVCANVLYAQLPSVGN